MAQRKKKMNGKFYYFPEGMSLEKKNGKPRIAVTVKIGGKISRKYFPATEQGYNSARDVAASIRDEKKRYGAEFGSVTEDEKMAIDMWRQYRDLCIRERCEYKSMSEVMKESLSNVVEVSISPTVEEAAQIYIDDKLRKNNGVLTDHLQTENNRPRRIANELGDIRMCNLTVKQIDDFLQGLMNPQKKTKAAPRTIGQYLALIKSVSSMMEKRGLLDAKKNVAKTMDAPKIEPKDPDILSLDEVCKIFEYVRDNSQEHVFIPALAVGFFCGARLSERSRLTHADILRGDRDEGYLSRMITKKNLPRYTYTYANFKAWMDFALSME